MSTTIAENSPVDVLERAGAKVNISTERTIPQTAEYRCRRDTRVGNRPEDITECGAAAAVHVIYSREADLERFYCSHHATREWDTLVKVAEEIRDERPSINAKPGGSAAS